MGAAWRRGCRARSTLKSNVATARGCRKALFYANRYTFSLGRQRHTTAGRDTYVSFTRSSPAYGRTMGVLMAVPIYSQRAWNFLVIHI